MRIAGQVDGFDAEASLGRRAAKRMDRFMQFAMVASNEAIADAGLEVGDDGLGDRAGVYVGSGIGGIAELVDGAEKMAESGVGPESLHSTRAHQPRGRTHRHGGGRARTEPVRQHGLRHWQSQHRRGAPGDSLGDADLILAGGAEASILPIGSAASWS